MPRNETYILILLLGTHFFGCDKAPEHTPVPQATSEQEQPTQAPSDAASFLNQQREKVDHEAKYQPKFEIDPHWVIFSNFKSPKPDNWTWTTPRSNMRIANYILAAVEEKDEAELSIIQFDKGEGGELHKNVERWKKQFRSSGGGPVKAVITKTTVADLPTTIIEITGEYMGMGGSWHRYNHTMLIALIEYEEGNLFLKLLGPKNTIDAHRNKWNSFLENVTFIEEN